MLVSEIQFLVLVVSISQVKLLLAEDESIVTVEVTTPINPVTVDGILAVQCQIWNIQNGDTVVLARTFEGGSEQISSGSRISESSAEDRVYLSIRTIPGGSTIYFLTMLNMLSTDKGGFACTVNRMIGLRSTEVGYDSIDIQVYSFPDETQLSCASNPQNLMVGEGYMLDLTCSAYNNFPVVDLKWRLLSTYEYLPSSNSNEGDTVIANVYVKIDLTHDGATFRCEMTSEGFPDRMRSCTIGPISVKPSKSTVNHVFSLTTRTPREIMHFDSTKPTGNCQNICPSSSDTIFYLTVSTAATCLLTIVFIITTCIMCFKHHGVSSNVRQRQRHVPTPPSLASDPVYVSLQRRNTNERVYMTLEDPNNPEGKVLLPKEVFDEFYNRTLSLRKT